MAMSLEKHSGDGVRAELGFVAPHRRQKRNFRPSKLLLLLLTLISTYVTLTVPSWHLWRSNRFQTASQPTPVDSDPAYGWKDDIWPLRQQTAWDISTDFPYPRSLEYDVDEGTWLRLDVHPATGDIIFDMLGDIYCLPADAWRASLDTGSLNSVKALPVLLGIPYDSDPHFSPSGGSFVFRSDAELGVENIWVRNWDGCVQENLRPDADSAADPKLRFALAVKEEEDKLLVQGVKESVGRRSARLRREGRLHAHRVTNETFRHVTDARFHPSGSKVVATKWFTLAGEGWEFDMPNATTSSISSGSGKRLTGRTLPPGGTLEDYGRMNVGPEMHIWSGNDSIIFSKNVKDTNGMFAYSKDVHKGIYAILTKNLTTGVTSTLVDAAPGGASRPELSRDGRTLAFVRRIRDKEALVLKDLTTGTLRDVWYGLTWDLTATWTNMGSYPSFAFTPSDDGIIIWAAGKIWHVALTVNHLGERVAAGTPAIIPFTAHIEKRLAALRSSETDIQAIETPEKQRLYAFKEMKIDETGTKAVFQAAGVTYIQRLGSDAPAAERVPTLHTGMPYYSPTFIHGADDLVLHARWSDVNFTSFELTDVSSGTVYEVHGLPLGRYYSPVLCKCAGSQRKIAFVKTGSDLMTGNVVATANPGIYIGDITLPSSPSDVVTVRNLQFIPSQIDFSLDFFLMFNLEFLEQNAKLLVQEHSKAFIIDLASGPDEFGNFKQHVLAEGRTSMEMVVSTRPSSGESSVEADKVAFVDFFHVYLAPAPKNQSVWSKPGNSTEDTARLSLDGGHDIAWGGDGKKLFWFLGPYLHSLQVEKLHACMPQVREDYENFGIDCVRNLLEYQEVYVDYSTDISRLKREAVAAHAPLDKSAADVVAIINATIVTMEPGRADDEPIQNGVLVMRGGVIESVSGAAGVAIPAGATVIDAQGGFVVPGFIDVHAHWLSSFGSMGSLHPATSYEMLAFLAYGVTTLHNPSADNVDTFSERARIESGLTVGPRIFHTGNIIFGLGIPGIHQDIVDYGEAYSALLRIKVEGGPASFSYKNYQLPSRASRQRLLLAAQNLSMVCVPEGGAYQDWDITYILDGMTTIEHNIPVPTLYDDVLTLYAWSGTAATPTHVVNYGGAWGEELVWATEDIPNDPKLRRFLPHDILQGITESSSRPMNSNAGLCQQIEAGPLFGDKEMAEISYALFNTSISVAKMVRKGLRTHIGAHGEKPIGLNYHAEMWFTKQGGLTNYEVLRAATADAATSLGLIPSLGTLSPGKLADLLIYPPGIDLLQDDIRHTRDIRFVVRGGRIWDAETLTEEWPNKGRKHAPLPPFNED